MFGAAPPTLTTDIRQSTSSRMAHAVQGLTPAQAAAVRACLTAARSTRDTTIARCRSQATSGTAPVIAPLPISTAPIMEAGMAEGVNWKLWGGVALAVGIAWWMLRK